MLPVGFDRGAIRAKSLIKIQPFAHVAGGGKASFPGG